MVEEVPMKPLLLLALAATAAWGQGTASLRARELFYTPPPDASAVKPPVTPPPAPTPKVVAKKTPAKSPAPAQPPSSAPTQAVVDKPVTGPLGMRYSVLKRNAAGEYLEVDADTVFHSGDRIRLEAQANSTGYLYVVAQGSSGNWTLLFPSKEVAGGSNHVVKGDSRQIPSGDRGQFLFDEQSGAEKLFIVLSRQPEPDLDKLIYSIGGTKGGTSASDRALVAQALVNDSLVSQLRQGSRDLVFEKVDSADTNGKLENAVYVANPSTAPDARLVTDLTLKHR